MQYDSPDGKKHLEVEVFDSTEDHGASPCQERRELRVTTVVHDS